MYKNKFYENQPKFWSCEHDGKSTPEKTYWNMQFKTIFKEEANLSFPIFLSWTIQRKTGFTGFREFRQRFLENRGVRLINVKIGKI